MPIYANFYYIPKDAAFVPDGEAMLAVVDRLLEDKLVQFDVPEDPSGRTRSKGLFARMREAVLGQVEAAKKQKKEEEPEPEPCLYAEPDGEAFHLTCREDLAEHEALTEKEGYLRIQIPYAAAALKERLAGRAYFELGFTLTRSPAPIPLIDAYKNIQTGCKACKHVFDPRDEMVSQTRVACPNCGAEDLLVKFKNTPPPPSARFVAGLEHHKVVDAQEDDPAHTGLDLKDLSSLFTEVLNVPFRGLLIYT